MILFIDWMANPAIFTIPEFSIGLFHLGPKEIRWYSLAFILSFFVFGYKIVERMWKKENINPNWLSSLFYYTFLGTIIGARLGHCLFYAPNYYLANPVEVLKVWEGGLASHDGVIGIIIAIWIYSKKVTKQSIFWTFDKLVVPTGLVAALIRLGNLMNHEIYGHPTDKP